MPVGTGPSFMSRLGAQMPGMVNSMAQDFGDPSMRGTVQGSSSLLKKQKSPMFGNRRAKSPGVTTGMPKGQIGTSVPMPRNPISTGPTTPMPGGINIQAPGLTPPPEMQVDMPMGMGPISTNPSQMMGGFIDPSQLGPLEFNGMPIPGMGRNNGAGGGLFDTYNRLRRY
jgi:hypothetical protein